MQETNSTEKNTFLFSNPIKGGFASLGISAMTALGASITGNDVHKEALTNLVGAAIVGAIAGSVGCCIPNADGFECGPKFAISLLQVAIGTGVTFTAPLMGETIMGLGTDYMSTVKDSLIGSGVFAGSALGLVGLSCAASYCAYSLFNKEDASTPVSTADVNLKKDASTPVDTADVSLNKGPQNV